MDKKILIVEDDPNIASLLRTRLSAHGFITSSADNGEKAFQMARTKQPDLILLDILLPKTNGFEVCRQLKQNAVTQNIPVIMVTALDSPTDLSVGLEVGAHCFITKPYNDEDLLEEINRVLES